MKFLEHERANISRDTNSHGDLRELSKDTKSRTELSWSLDKFRLVCVDDISGSHEQEGT